MILRVFLVIHSLFAPSFQVVFMAGFAWFFDRHRSTFILWGLKARFIHVLDGKTRNTDFQKVTSFSASRESQRILRKTQFESSNNDRTFVFHKKTSNQKIQIGKKTWKLRISDKNFLPFPTTKNKGIRELLLIPLIRNCPGSSSQNAMTSSPRLGRQRRRSVLIVLLAALTLSLVPHPKGFRKKKQQLLGESSPVSNYTPPKFNMEPENDGFQ